VEYESASANKSGKDKKRTEVKKRKSGFIDHITDSGPSLFPKMIEN